MAGESPPCTCFLDTIAGRPSLSLPFNDKNAPRYASAYSTSAV